MLHKGQQGIKKKCTKCNIATYTEDELLGLFLGSLASNIVQETSLPIDVMTDTTSGLDREREKRKRKR